MKRFLVVLAILTLATAANANLLTNGSFENGMTGWAFDKSSWSGGDPGNALSAGPLGIWTPGSIPDGSNVAGKSVGNSLNGDGWEYQTFPTVVGTTYSLTGLFSGGVGAAQNLSGSGAWWEVDLYAGAYSNAATDAGNGMVAKQAHSSTTNTGWPNGWGFGWTNANQTFTATDTQYTLNLKWGAITNWNYFGAYYDKFDVSAVPEPGSILALVTGFIGLGVIRRRK